MTNITTLRPGEHFMFKGFEWVCLDPNHPDGGVLAIMATPWKKDVKFCQSDKFADEKGNWNNYCTSNVRGILSDMANAVFEKKSLLYNYGACNGGAVAPACILNPKSLNLRKNMAFVEDR